MKRKLLLLTLIPFLGISQNSDLSQQEKNQLKIESNIKSAFHIANRTMNINTDKTLKQVLDSVAYDEFYTNPNEYVPFYKFEFKYNNQGLNTSQYTWIYDFQADTMGKTVHNYNLTNQLISSITTQKNTSVWENDSKKYYSYNLAGYVTQVVDSSFNTTTSLFGWYMTLDLTYNGNNQLTEILATFPTYNEQKMIFEYNLDGTLNKEYVKFGNANSNSTVFNDQRIYTFQYTASNSTTTLKERYDNGSQLMISDGRLEKYYNSNFTKNNLILPIGLIYTEIFAFLPEDLIGSYSNRLDSINNFSANQNLNGRTKYYYNQKDILATNKIQQNKELKIYPNPSTGILHFNNLSTNNKIQLIDITGKSVYENKNFQTKTIDLSNLNNGVYILTLTDLDNKTVKTERIIINK